MHRLLLHGIILAATLTATLIPKCIYADELPSSQPAVQIKSGKWTYRSFHNRPEFVTGSADEALSLYFAEATFNLAFDPQNRVSGQLDWQGGGLDLTGVLHPATDSAPATVELVGTGRTGTGTEGWEYDYYGHLAHIWPNGLNQVPVIVGSVLRGKPHNGAPAGYVASFFAVKQ